MRMSTQKFKEMKLEGQKIPMVTAYDYTFAKIVDGAGIPIILVGDSLAQWSLGYDNTLSVTMEEMLHHVKAVVRGTARAHVVADMPFMSYQADVSDAVRNAGRMLQEGGAQSVKLEGGVSIAGTVDSLVKSGIPVMGHVGFTPQSINQIGGFKIQGKVPKTALSIIKDAQSLESAGAYAVVLEMVPAELAEILSNRLSIPTIGIASGVYCDGQVQVLHDMLGLIEDFSPKHARKYVSLAESISVEISKYINDVETQAFPSDLESHHMTSEALKQFRECYK